MTNKIVKRAALALSDRVKSFKVDNKPGDVLSYEEMVKTVLKAIEIPTHEMIRAGSVNDLYNDSLVWAWQAMINAALQDENN